MAKNRDGGRVSIISLWEPNAREWRETGSREFIDVVASSSPVVRAGNVSDSLATEASAAVGKLLSLVTSDKLDAIAEKAFSASGNDVASAVSQMARSGWPTVVLVDGADLRGAAAAYIAGTDTIQISRESYASGADIQALLLEEFGHAIDARLMHGDAPGDEGAVFSALIRGQAMTTEALASLRQEDDHGTVLVNGATMAAEFAGTYGSITLDGALADWTAADRIDTSGGTTGYEVYGKYVGNAYVFAIKAPVAIGANTTAWLNTDLNAATGYQIFGFAGGAEYNVNFNATGVPALYSGAAGSGTSLGTIDHAYSADRKIVEFAVLSTQIGSPAAIGAMFDVNDATYLSNDYSNNQYVVRQPVVVTPPVVGSVTLDGNLAEWTAAQRIDTSLGTAGYEIYARIEGDNYIFALKSAVVIGANSTAWLNTDRNAATGYQIFGSTGGAEYNVNFNAAGTPALYTGAAGATLVGSVQHGFSADHKSVEFAVAKSDIGSPTSINTLFDINNSVYLSSNYASTQYTVAPPVVTNPVVGGVTLDGSLADWTQAMRIDNGNVPAGYELYGRVAGDSFIIAIKAPTAIGANTTAWLNTDQNAATGFKVFGASGGAEFNVNFGSDGRPSLFTGDAGETPVAAGGNLLHGFSADKTVVEFAVTKAMIGSPIELDMIFDINNSVFLPTNYVGAQYEIVDTTQLPVQTEASRRVAIVFSETTASAYFSSTAYSQLVMAAQSQAVNAGIPYDLISENDLTNINNLLKYDAIVFPSFRNAPLDKYIQIQNTLELAAEQYKISLIAAGDFMTSDATGAVLPGDPYARMKQFFDVTREGGLSGQTTVNATNVTHPVMAGYAANEVIHNYANIFTSYYQDATPGSTAPTVIATQTTAGQTHNAVVATTTNGARNVHFATEAFLGDNNQLQHAIDWSVNGAGVTAGLQIGREAGVFAARNDMDQSSYISEAAPVDANGNPAPGLYDTLIPLLQQWKSQYDFVGSYYLNVGDHPLEGWETNWARALPYYKAIADLGNELGSHSLTHLQFVSPSNDTNVLTTGTGPGTFDYEFNQAKIILNQQIASVIPGFSITGAAVPGAPETVATALQILQYYNYLSGGYSGIGAGYPGAFGYLNPDSSKVYLAPNLKFDFSLILTGQMTPAQALDEWKRELDEVGGHSDVPVFVWPWHDYGLSTAETGYSTAMYAQFIAYAASKGVEFVTLDDLSRRVSSMEKALINYTVTGNVVSASITSTDAGKFAFDLDGLGTQKIASVANWYAYDDDSVFLPRNGGNYTITLGAAATDVTRIIELPSRAELVSLTGNGTNLSFTAIGEGKVVVDLKNQPGATLTVTGATVVSRVGDILTLDIGAVGSHAVSITLGTNAAPVITSNGGGATASISRAENLTAVTTVTSTDADAGQTRSHSISGGADAAKFAIDPNTGALTFITAPDFENRQDVGANNVYDVIVRVTDAAGAFDTQAIAVTVTNVTGPTQTGNNSANTLNGTAEEETIRGGGGNDTINGNSGNDILEGEAGNDNINGGDGADRIRGGAGNDTQTGGLGSDTFVFDTVADIGNGTTPMTRDVITDFEHLFDRIDFSAIDASTQSSGNNAFSFLTTAGAAFTAPGQVRYSYSVIDGAEHTIVEGNTDLDSTPEFRLDLVGHITLAANDFVL